MGGAVGHIFHLHENRSLTFNELFDVLNLAANGTLEKVSEKFDGMNIVFTWHNDNLVVARTGSDIVNGGMDYHQLLNKFSSRENIKKAFEQAFNVLQQSLQSLSDDSLHEIFDKNNSKYWYSAEIIYPSGINTINYDLNCLVFHGYPIFKKSNFSTKISMLSDYEGVEILKNSIDLMQKSIKLKGWKIIAPTFIKLQSLSDRFILDKTYAKIDEALAIAGVDRSATIKQYLFEMAFDRGKMIGLSDNVASKFASRIINDPKAPNVLQLVKMSPGHKNQLISLVSNDKKLVAEFIKPIEYAICEFAGEVLNGLHSILIADADKEIERQQASVKIAIDSIKKSGNVELLSKLETNLLKLRGVDKIKSAIEGVVFIYKDQMYKFTGNWAPCHQILSLYKRNNL